MDDDRYELLVSGCTGRITTCQCADCYPARQEYLTGKDCCDDCGTVLHEPGDECRRCAADCLESVAESDGEPTECSICRGVHGSEVQHACE